MVSGWSGPAARSMGSRTRHSAGWATGPSGALAGPRRSNEDACNMHSLRPSSSHPSWQRRVLEHAGALDRGLAVRVERRQRCLPQHPGRPSRHETDQRARPNIRSSVANCAVACVIHITVHLTQVASQGAQHDTSRHSTLPKIRKLPVGRADRAQFGGPVYAAIESMNGARFVHDQLELVGWQVETADAGEGQGLAPAGLQDRRPCRADRRTTTRTSET